MLQYPLLLIAHLIGWALYGLFEHISHLVYGSNHWFGSFFSALIGCLLTGVLGIIFDKIKEFQQILRTLLLISFALVISLFWHNISRILHDRISYQSLINSSLDVWFSGGSYSVLLIAAWCGLSFSLLFYLQNQQKQKELLLLSVQTKEAQLQSLRYQLNPHFLFNVLNSIDVAVQEKNTDIAHSMLLKLSRFLRTTLELDYSDKVRLSDEMSLLSDFIEIEQQRYQGKISINKQVDLQCENAFIPPLILQPLIENAIKFSWQNKYEKYIELSCHKVSEKLIIKITNPISREKYNVKNKGVGIGLKNTASRLSMLYGTKAHVTSITESERFIVTLELPWEEGF